MREGEQVVAHSCCYNEVWRRPDVLLPIFSCSARCRSVSTATVSISAFLMALIANEGHMTPPFNTYLICNIKVGNVCVPYLFVLFPLLSSSYF